MEQFFTYNGKLFPVGKPVFDPSNSAFKYGDSLFETIRLSKGELPLFDFHMERLFRGMKALSLQAPNNFNQQMLQDSILKLASENGIVDHGRVRLTVFRENENEVARPSSQTGYVIECNSLPLHYQQFNEDGYTIDIAVDNRKGLGSLSNLKSGNYLVYILAAQVATQLQVNECLVLNSMGNIADSSIFNLFLIRNNILYTPPLDQGPVAGVVRRYLIDHFREAGNPVQETPISTTDLEQADEVFLTNALFGIRWVKSFRTFTYRDEMTRRIYFELFQQNLRGIV